MMKIVTTLSAVLLAVSFAATANAATKSTSKSEARQHIAQREAACKEQAAKKVSAIHFIKRRELVNNCMGRTAQAKVVKTHSTKAMASQKKAPPVTTGQSVK
jgi:hypothetical protein